MAQLRRPSVEIDQQLSAAAPTVLEPDLVACIVGPCFQIVEPLDADGALNAKAQVLVGAVIRSSAAVGAAIAGSGMKLSIAVDGAPGQVINLPVTINGVTLSQEIVQNSINAQLTGATALFQDNKLVLSTVTKGKNARLKLEVIAADAYALLNLTENTETTGADGYTGQDYEVSYSDLPSPMASIDEVSIDGDDVTPYRYFANTLQAFRDDAAGNWNSYTGSASEFANALTSLAHQPALGNARTNLTGRRIPGSKTNTLVHTGREASIRIPLGHDATDSGTVAWPDVTGLNWLNVEAIGLQNWRADQANGVPGNFIGAAGNDVNVTFSLNAGLAADTAAFVWNSGPKTLDIQRQSANVTYDSLKAALTAGVTGLDTAKDLIITLNFADGMGSKVFLPAALLQAPWHLGGGEDAPDFGADHTTIVASITGSMPVEDDDDATEDLGISGKLSLSIHGGPWIDVNMSGVVVDAINAVDGITCTSVAVVSHDDDNANVGVGISANVLRISTTAAGLGPDSSLEIKADNDAILETLFGGFKSRTATLTDIGTAGGAGWQVGRRRHVLAQSNYNSRAGASRDGALVPGAQTIAYTGLTSPAFILCDLSAAALDDHDGVLEITHSAHNAGAPEALAIDAFVGTPTLSQVVTEIDEQIQAESGAGAGLDLLFGVSEVNGRICFFDRSGVDGATISLVAEATGNTTAAFETALGGADDFFDTDATTVVNASCKIQDKGADFALRVVEVGHAFSNGIFPSSFDVTSETELTDSVLSSTADESAMVYDTGAITITFSGEQVVGRAVDPDDEKPLLLRFTGAGDATTSDTALTFRRVWANAYNASPTSYAGRLFTGGAAKVKPGDMMYDNGAILGRVVAINDFVIGGTTFTGGELVLSEFSVDNSKSLANWYIVAENLPDAVDRPSLAPEMVVDTVLERFVVKGGVNRDAAGIPMGGVAPVYVGYRALRKDVSAAAVSPEMLTFNSADEVESLIGPVIPSNPLAFGLAKAFLNRTNVNISAMGLGEVTPDAPNGTVDAYAQALDFLRKKEVYALAPLTQDAEVTKLFNLHVTDMSVAEQGKERIAFVNEALPTEKVSTLIISGLMTITDIGGGKFELEFTDETLNVSTAIDGKLNADGEALSGAAGTDYTPDDGVYLDRAGDAFKWLVTKVVSATVVQIDSRDVYVPGFGPGTGGNDDGYFRTAAADLDDFEVDGELCSILVRQAAVKTNTTGGRLAVCETMAEITGGATGLQNRRLFYTQPEKVGTDSAGTEIVVPGYYLCAAQAAMVAQLPAQQPHTNLPMVGFTRPIGSSDLFSEDEMATAASGGVFWMIQDAPGGPIACRHQLSTDLSSIKSQELSITKAIDIYAKAIRSTTKRMIGRNVIDKSLLDALNIALQAVSSKYAGPKKALAAASVSSIAQDTARPDGVLVTVDTITWYPFNRLRLTIVA